MYCIMVYPQDAKNLYWARPVRALTSLFSIVTEVFIIFSFSSIRTQQYTFSPPLHIVISQTHAFKSSSSSSSSNNWIKLCAILTYFRYASMQVFDSNVPNIPLIHCLSDSFFPFIKFLTGLILLRVSYTGFFFSLYESGASRSGFDKDSSLRLSVSGCRIVNVYGRPAIAWSLHCQHQAVQEGPLHLECLSLKMGTLRYFEISVKICHFFF